MNEKKSYYENLNFIRVFLATLVTWSHCYPLSGGSYVEPVTRFISTETGGSIAVKAFFFISGFLVTKSWIQSNSVSHFIVSRAVRILPALICALVLTIALAYIASASDTKTFLASSFDYFFKNITLFSGVAYELPGAYANQASNSVNGSLWTLPWEVRAYLGLMIIGAIGILNYKALTNIVLLTISFGLLFPNSQEFYDNNEVPLMLISFIAGAFLAKNITQEKISSTSIIFLIVGIILFFLGHHHFGILLFIFFVISILGFTDLVKLPRVKNDTSFGIYVYSYPVQQLIIFFVTTINPIVLFIFTLAIVYPISIASWIFIEKPALHNRGKIMSSLKIHRIPKRLIVVLISIFLVYFLFSLYQKSTTNVNDSQSDHDSFYWGIYFSEKKILSLRESLTPGFADIDIMINNAEAVPLLGKWHGDSTSLAIFDKQNCVFSFYADLSTKEKLFEKSLPCSSSQPQPLAGDWYGDGKIHVGIYFSDLGLVSLEGKEGNNIDFLFGMPNSNLKAITGDWDGDGKSTIALWNSKNNQFDFINKNESSVAEVSFRFKSNTASPFSEPFSMKNPDGSYSVGIYNGKVGILSFISVKTGNELFTLEYGEKDSKGIPIFLNN